MQRILTVLLVVLVAAGCLSSGPAPETSSAPRQARAVNHLVAPDAKVVDQGLNRTFEWTGTLGAGAEASLATGALLNSFDHKAYKVPVDASVSTLELSLTGPGTSVAQLRTVDNRLACTVRTGRVCTTEVRAPEATNWNLVVTSLEPQGTTFTLKATLSPQLPRYGNDPTTAGGFTINEARTSGGEPTLGVLKDGRVLVVAGSRVLRMSTDGTFTDVTPPIDRTDSATLDPFLYGDPVTGRVYNSQLVSCMRVAWTDDGGGNWMENPFSCAGPDQHHQKITTGPGPVPGQRAVYIGMMNLATWLTTDDAFIQVTRSFDGGLTWSQNPALVKQVHGIEPRAMGNIATTDNGNVHIVAYLCDGFVDSHYNGLAVGRSTDYGATWTWKQIGKGSGLCEGIDPGIATAGNNVYAAWWDHADGTPKVWWAESHDAGATWSEQRELPTPGLHSFEMVDAAANKDRLVVHFIASPDTAKGDNQADGWARWFPYVASLDTTNPAASWVVHRLEDHPIQLGPICIDGPMCLDGARNLLDFNDIQLGPDGRAYVAYTDGCNANCTIQWESRRADLRIAVENPS